MSIGCRNALGAVPNPESVAVHPPWCIAVTYLQSHTSKVAGLTLRTCHDCLLHPPPLVDLAQDRKILGFFLSSNAGPATRAYAGPPCNSPRARADASHRSNQLLPHNRRQRAPAIGQAGRATCTVPPAQLPYCPAKSRSQGDFLAAMTA